MKRDSLQMLDLACFRREMQRGAAMSLGQMTLSGHIVDNFLPRSGKDASSLPKPWHLRLEAKTYKQDGYGRIGKEGSMHLKPGDRTEEYRALPENLSTGMGDR